MEENEVYQMDCFDFLELMKKERREIDTIYFDSPYKQSTLYSTHYEVLDQILEEKMDIEIGDTAFNKNDALNNFERLFSMSTFIPHWVISMGHNVDSDKGIRGEELLSVVQKFKPAKLIFLEHNWTINNLAAKSGKKQGENVEYLIISE